jgi:hypothetical protein
VRVLPLAWRPVLVLLGSVMNPDPYLTPKYIAADLECSERHARILMLRMKHINVSASARNPRLRVLRSDFEDWRSRQYIRVRRASDINHVLLPKIVEVRPAEPKRGVIYFIQSVDGGPIKIGFSTKLKQRFEQIQRTSPTELRVLASIPGEMKFELHLHEKFKHARVRSEWFEPSDDLLSYIAEVRCGNFDAA